MCFNGVGCPGLNPSLSRTVLAGPGHSAGTHATSLPWPLLGHKQGNEVCCSSQGVTSRCRPWAAISRRPGRPAHPQYGWAGHTCVCVCVRVGGWQDHMGRSPSCRYPWLLCPTGPPRINAAEVAPGRHQSRWPERGPQALRVGDVTAAAAAPPGSELSSPCLVTGSVLPEPGASSIGILSISRNETLTTLGGGGRHIFTCRRQEGPDDTRGSYKRRR